MLIKNRRLRKPNLAVLLYSQRYTGSHFLWLSGPHSVSVPFLINQDRHSLMHRDEQSAWQAGSYSSLTPASAEWCNRTAGLLPFLLLLIPFPHFLPSPHLFSLCLFHTLHPFIIPIYFFTSILSLLPFTRALVLPLGISFYPEAHVSVPALHTITSIHQLSAYSSLATPLPSFYSITPPLSWLHMFSMTPISYPPPAHSSLPWDSWVCLLSPSLAGHPHTRWP